MAGEPQYPALNLYPLNYPLNDSFVPKHILLAGGIRVKIGRQTNARTVPGEKNGYFDSKVLSRQHAEVWEEGGKIYIKDVKSSNGTFINGTRLSPEGVESQPFELNTEDVAEFGIDIVGEDNQTIIHHKVAAKVQCILTPEDAQAAQQSVYNQQMRDAHMQQHQQPHMQGGPPGRRPAMHVPNHQTNLGQIAPVLRPNKTGLSFDVILNRLQNELNRSKETASDLQTLNSTITDIHESLSGVAPPPPPPFPRILPPVRQGSDPAFAAAAASAAEQAPSGTAEPQAINSLQEQLQQTQSLLSTHVEKMHNLDLETVVGEHDGMKREIGMLRDLIDQRQRELELKRQLQLQKAIEDDDDDAKSVGTVIAGGQFHEDEDEENDDERRQRREELGRPRTPEPSLGDGDSDGEGDIGVRTINIRNRGGTIRGSWNGDASGSAGGSQHKPELAPASRESVDKLTERLEQLAIQFVSAIELSKSLQTQQQVAQEQIAFLQAKVDELEGAKEQWATASAQSEEKQEMKEAGATVALFDLNKSFEGKWERQREAWEEERARLNEARLEWEQRVRKVEEDVNGLKELATAANTAAVEASSVASAAEKSIAALSTQLSTPPANGVAHKTQPPDLEFQAPPSPRSLSSDSTRARRKRPSSPTRSRSTSRSSQTKPLANGHMHIESEGGLIASFPNASKFFPGAFGGSVDGRSPLSPQNGPRLQVRPKSSTEDVDAATSVSPSNSSPLSRKSDPPVPYFSAIASASILLVGIAAYIVSYQIHD